MKKAVIFDLGGVLFYPPQRAIAAYEKELGLPRGAVAYAFIHGVPDNAFCRMERGELTLSQFFPEFDREVCELVSLRGLTLSGGFSARELFQRITANSMPITEMLQTVKRLKEAGYKTGAITNNWIDDTRDQSDIYKLDQFLKRHFDVVLESCKLGIRKPDERIYQLACKMLKVLPEEAVFLDDLGTNLKPAKKLGMATIKVQDTSTAIAELESILGITLAQHSRTQSPPSKL